MKPKQVGLMGRAIFGSLGANLKLGAQSLFNIWVLTLPPCALWLFAWWGGWENSFNKGYEQFAVGPSVAQGRDTTMVREIHSGVELACFQFLAVVPHASRRMM